MSTRIRGTVLGAQGSVVAIYTRMESEAGPLERRPSRVHFHLETPEGLALAVVAEAPTLGPPTEEVEGEWSELGQSSLAQAFQDATVPGGEVELTEATLRVGDLVVVEGELELERADGYRERGEERPEAVRATAIGIGEGAEDWLDEEPRRIERERRERERREREAAEDAADAAEEAKLATLEQRFGDTSVDDDDGGSDAVLAILLCLVGTVLVSVGTYRWGTGADGWREASFPMYLVAFGAQALLLGLYAWLPKWAIAYRAKQELWRDGMDKAVMMWVVFSSTFGLGIGVQYHAPAWCAELIVLATGLLVFGTTRSRQAREREKLEVPLTPKFIPPTVAVVTVGSLTLMEVMNQIYFF